MSFITLNGNGAVFFDLESQNTINESENEDTTLSKSSSLFSKYIDLKEGTIFHLFEKGRVEQEKKKYQNSSWSSRFKHSVSLGCKMTLRASPLVLGFTIYTYLNSKGPSHTFMTRTERAIQEIARAFIPAVVIAPIVEEIMFRGILQNGIHGGQILAEKIAPKCISETEAFKKITSPEARILGAHIPFALAHLNNASAIGLEFAIGQTTNLLLQPAISISNEIGGIDQSITTHAVNNFCTVMLGVTLGFIFDTL
ncbi:MAG: hypothetical protein CMO81_06605 [Waddliaceae bacterium]|nr:hypothetical protein [Waddliaceae bacterium]